MASKPSRIVQSGHQLPIDICNHIYLLSNPTTSLPELHENHALNTTTSLPHPRAKSYVSAPPSMSWFSILPANLTVIETWIVRFFVSPLPPPPPQIPTNTTLPAPPRHHDHRSLGPLRHLRYNPLHHPRCRLRNPLYWRASTW